MARSTYFDLGRSADACPGSESGYAQRFQCGNIVKRRIWTRMTRLAKNLAVEFHRPPHFARAVRRLENLPDAGPVSILLKRFITDRRRGCQAKTLAADDHRMEPVQALKIQPLNCSLLWDSWVRVSTGITGLAISAGDRARSPVP